MKLIDKITIIGAYVIMFNFVVIEPASAYLDPGTGSFILQLLVAAFVGIIASVKIFWSKIKNIFTKKG